MANRKEKTTGENTVVSGGAEAKDEPKFTLENLGRHCRELFGVSTVTFAGATSGIEQKEYTVKEIKDIINKWCKKEVN